MYRTIYVYVCVWSPFLYPAITMFSDADATARKEVGFFFPEFDFEEWYRRQHPLFINDLVEFDPEKMQHIAIPNT